MKKIFPLNDTSNSIETRFRETFKVLHARTERLKNSAIPYMQRLLNSAVRSDQDIFYVLAIWYDACQKQKAQQLFTIYFYVCKK